jgi:hypothetical protein
MQALLPLFSPVRRFGVRAFLCGRYRLGVNPGIWFALSSQH